MTNNLVCVQALRGLAAMTVVLYHAANMARDRLGASVGALAGASGVDIFFAISGFIMVMTTASSLGRPGAWRDFLTRRLLRIAPLYWLATSLKVASLALAPSLAQHSNLAPWHTIASYLFIPAWNVEHVASPLLVVGWTLSFEMLFYLLFAVGLAATDRPHKWIIAMLAVAASASLWRAEDWGAVATLLDPILLEFIFGMLIARAVLSGWLLSPIVAALVIPAAATALILTNDMAENTVMTYRSGLWGVPAALLLYAAISLERPLRRSLAGLPALVGDASYSIYLSHGFVLPVVGVGFARLHLEGAPWTAAAMGSGVVVSAIAGLVIHRMVEKPLTRRLSARRTPVSEPLRATP